MSYMADRDHIAITSRDASTTRRKVSGPGCPGCTPIAVTHGKSSDTYRRIAGNSEIVQARRNWLEDAGIRGVCRNCRMLAYQAAARAAVQVTRSSLLSVTGRYGRHRPSGPVPCSCRQYA